MHSREHPGVSVVVLNWNGTELLKECLPSVVRAAERYPGPTEVVVVDNGSEDSSLELLRRSFSSVRILELGRNHGFPGGCNQGVGACRHPLVWLLNNDVAVEPDAIEPLVETWRARDAFAVSSRMMHWDRTRTFGSAIRGEFLHGQFVQCWAVGANAEDLCPVPAPSLYASGGAMLFSRKEFTELGGFDPLFHPFYWEDTDLAYRAWKRGRPTWHEPRSVVHHKVSASIERSDFDRDFLMARNRYLFHWANLSDAGLMAAHAASLPLVFARSVIERGPIFAIRSLGGALRRFPQAWRRRRSEKPHRVLCDRDVIARADWRLHVAERHGQERRYG